MRNAILLIVAIVGLSACKTKAQLIQESPVLSKMVRAGAGDPAQYTREGLVIWFNQHPGMAMAVVGERGRVESAEPYDAQAYAVEQWERTVRGAAVDQIANSNAFGYADPIVTGDRN